MNKATIRSVFLVLIFSLCTNNALAHEFSMYADPENARSIFIFEGGRVVFDDINGTITVGLSSGQNFAFTVDEVAEDIAVNQEHKELLIHQAKQAVLDLDAAGAYHSHRPNPTWGAPSTGNDPSPPGSFQPRHHRPDGLKAQFNVSGDWEGLPGCLSPTDPLCDRSCLFQCSPFIGLGGVGKGYSFLLDGGSGDLGSASERECKANHYREWLTSQSGVCDLAVSKNYMAITAGIVAAGSCMNAANSPNWASGLVCAGSYLGLLGLSWQAFGATAQCQETYPGPGSNC